MSFKSIDKKKAALDAFRPLPPELVSNLENWFRIELTYSSNAIEGNTLTRQETALVVEKGLAVGGKTLKEHLEATNHASALDYVRDLVKQKHSTIKLKDILRVHELILKGIEDAHAGHFRSVPVRISGSAVVLPNPRKVPDLMQDFVNDLSASKMHPVEIAAHVHYELVTIHPFVDGNGRTARLLMNLVLMMNGYPPAIIQMRDRLAYLNALEKAQLGGSKKDYDKLIYEAVDRSLDIYLKAATNEDPLETKPEEALLKIGQLAKLTNESTSTIRFWTKERLLDVAHVTTSGYQLFSRDMVSRVRKIQKLQSEERLSIAEIREKQHPKSQSRRNKS